MARDAVPREDGPVGRFAPSPSGPLHFGSLVSALASYLDSRSQNGDWLVRIDDLDAPRTTQGSEDAILQTLEAHHLLWDGVPTRQSDNQPHYTTALQQLADKGLLFFCTCSRKSQKGLQAYPGTCRANVCSVPDLNAQLALAAGDHRSALRLQVPDCDQPFHDELQGPQTTQLMRDGGDYVVLRRDGLISYQLAVVIDDARTGVTRVVRGADLLPTTGRQHHLHTQLGYTAPSWLHLPIVLNERHSKLSKQARSLAITTAHPSTNLNMALQLLGQQPPRDAHLWSATELVGWAIDHWVPAQLPATPAFENFFGW